jgi:hypothetical protein
MGKHVRNKHITRNDLMEREASLLLYLASHVGDLRQLLNVTMLNYTLSSYRWSRWAVSLASLQQEMEARSASLSSLARSGGSAIPTMATKHSNTSASYSTKCEERNDNPETPL